MQAPESFASTTTAAPGVPAQRTGTAILGLGAALPERVVTNAEITAVAGIEEEWILKRTGITTRHRVASPDAKLHLLAAEACRGALAEAGVDAVDIDLVLVGTCSADDLLPSTAAQMASTLGCTRAGAMDVNAACAGFVTALAQGAAMIEAGRARHVLVVGAEILSRITDHQDRKTAALFGDGAGAVVIGASATASDVGPVVLGADGASSRILYATREEQLVRMNGAEVFKHAVARMGASSIEACELAGVSLSDLDLYVFHQANARILEALVEQLELDPSRVVNAIATQGNTSAASIPLALHLARVDGRLHGGDRVLLSAFGAGLTWGATVVTWGQPDAA